MRSTWSGSQQEAACDGERGRRGGRRARAPDFEEWDCQRCTVACRCALALTNGLTDAMFEHIERRALPVWGRNEAADSPRRSDAAVTITRHTARGSAFRELAEALEATPGALVLRGLHLPGCPRNLLGWALMGDPASVRGVWTSGRSAGPIFISTSS